MVQTWYKQGKFDLAWLNSLPTLATYRLQNCKALSSHFPFSSKKFRISVKYRQSVAKTLVYTEIHIERVYKQVKSFAFACYSYDDAMHYIYHITFIRQSVQYYKNRHYTRYSHNTHFHSRDYSLLSL